MQYLVMIRKIHETILAKNVWLILITGAIIQCNIMSWSGKIHEKIFAKNAWVILNTGAIYFLVMIRQDSWKDSCQECLANLDYRSNYLMQYLDMIRQDLWKDSCQECPADLACLNLTLACKITVSLDKNLAKIKPRQSCQDILLSLARKFQDLDTYF